MKEMKVHCLYDHMMRTLDLKPHPKNRNKHPQEQVERLAKILDYQGWRYPIKISIESGYITSGHGRLLAAIHNGWKTVPVQSQHYESEEMEFADVQADNAIASWAELDFSGINSDLAELGPDFDIEMIGLKNFLLEPAEKFLNEDLWDGDFEKPDPDFKVIVIVKSEMLQKEVIRILNVKKIENQQNGKLISVRWPQIENE